jgi:periplasmic protein CpxP/Spy
MKIFPGRIWSPMFLAAGLALIAPGSGLAFQATATQQTPRETTPAQPNNAQPDPITQLNLSPEQRQQIRTIREQSKDERAAVNQHVRETTRALREAQDADPPNESLIEQRARDAGDARAALIRLQALTESRIRRVLTPEQIKTLRVLREQAQQAHREQRIENRNGAKEPAANRRALRAQRNGIPPLRRNGLPPKQQP